jgi:hypothetical protein
VGGFGWVDGALGAVKVVGNNNLRKLIIPGVVVTGMSSYPHPLSLFNQQYSLIC